MQFWIPTAIRKTEPESPEGWLLSVNMNLSDELSSVQTCSDSTVQEEPGKQYVLLSSHMRMPASSRLCLDPCLFGNSCASVMHQQSLRGDKTSAYCGLECSFWNIFNYVETFLQTLLSSVTLQARDHMSPPFSAPSTGTKL